MSSALRLDSCSPDTRLVMHFRTDVKVQYMVDGRLETTYVGGISGPRRDFDDSLPHLLGVHFRAVSKSVPIGAFSVESSFADADTWVYVPWSNIRNIQTNPPEPENVG